MSGERFEERPTKRRKNSPIPVDETALREGHLTKARKLASQHIGYLAGMEDDEILPPKAIKHLCLAFSKGICKEEASNKLKRLSALKRGSREDMMKLYERFLVEGWVGLEATRATQMDLEHIAIEAKAPPLVSNASLRDGNPNCASCWDIRYKGKSMSGPVDC